MLRWSSAFWDPRALVVRSPRLHGRRGASAATSSPAVRRGAFLLSLRDVCYRLENPGLCSAADLSVRGAERGELSLSPDGGRSRETWYKAGNENQTVLQFVSSPCAGC